MAIPIANLSAVLTGAAEAAKAMATEILPAAVTRVVEATRTSVAWLATHLWSLLAMARSVAVEHLPTGAAAAGSSALEAAASGPWIQAAARLFHGAYAWLAAAVVEKLPDVAAERLLGDAAAWVMGSRGGGGWAVVYTAAAVALLAAAFVGGAVWALTCRTMKAPGIGGGVRVPRAVFKASPKRYYAAVRAAKKARRGGCCGGGGAGWRMLLAGIGIAVVAYLAAKVLY
ncbi:hypothetical protein HU200_018281 [Digitaria exilis]|uniref:Uncharacterized protein n=1 Tax=Digitaria exilis TaxID=1010633 RepID=A0A835F5R6_9POAL|nr:hypothetical protein HU200_018281 [Digitaria exilis]CAB3500506.1 unnamed protein product [Digitaria exilis]